MKGHRYEIGECVTYIEKRFPNGERHTELVVLERLPGAGEPQYQLRGPDGPSLYVLAERQLSPRGLAQGAARPLSALAPGESDSSGSPWAA